MKTCPLCKETFDGKANGQVSPGEERADHYIDAHQDVLVALLDGRDGS